MNLNLTLLFQVLFFGIFVWFSKRYVWTPLIGALHARKATIADGLAAAEKGRQAEDDGRKRGDEVIADAKTQAADIINRANARGNELVDEAKVAAHGEADRITTAARAEIDTEINKARETLRADVGALAVAGARQILHREIDAKTHAKLLDELAAKL